MSIRSICPSCGHKRDLPDRLAGKTVECKECGEDFVVPSEEDKATQKKDERVKASSPPPLPGKERKPSRRRPDDDEEDEDTPRRKRRPEPTGSNASLYLVIGGIGAVVLLLLACMVPALFFMVREDGPGAQPIAQIDAPNPPPIVNPPPIGKPPIPGKKKRPPIGPEPKVPPPPVVHWVIQPDPGPDLTRAPQNPAGFLQLVGNLPEIVYPCTPSPFVAVRHGPFRKEGWQILDLQSFKPVGAINKPLELTDPILSPDGKYLAGKGKFQKNLASVHVVSAVDGRPVQTIQFDYKTGALQALEFIENGHLLLFKNRGLSSSCEVFNITTGNEVKQFIAKGQLERKRNLAFSPGRKYMAIAHDKQIDIYQPLTGQHLAKIRMPITTFAASNGLAFSHDGKELACLIRDFSSSSRLLSWKMADGAASVDHKFVKQIDTLVKNPFGYKGEIMEWTPDGSGWLLFGQLLVDYQSGAPIHTIEFDVTQPYYGTRRFFGTNHVVLTKGAFAKLAIAFNALPGADIAAAAKAARASSGPAGDAVPVPDAKAGNLATAKMIPAPNGVVAWAADLDPAPLVKTRFAPQPIALRSKAAEIQSILFSSGSVGQAVVVSETTPNVLAARKVIRADRFDLVGCKLLNSCDLFALNKQAAPFPVPPPSSSTIRADLSPDGTRLAVRRTDDLKRIDVWNLVDSKPFVSWQNDANIDALVMIDADRVLTSGGNKLILWKLPECQAIYVAAGYGGALQLSPGRKYVAVAASPTLTLVETATGECKGQFSQAGGLSGAFLSGAFSRDGKEFAGAFATTGGNAAKLARWSAANGNWLGSCQGNAGERPMAFTGKQVLHGGNLYDWNLKGPLWNYFAPGNPSPNPARAAPDGRHWFVASAPNGSLLMAQTLPDAGANALSALVAAGQVKPAVTPGMAIQLQVNGGNEKFRAAAQNNMPRDWQAKGYKIGPGGLTVSVSAQERATGQTIAYSIQKVGNPFGKGETIKIAEREVACQYVVTDAMGAVLLKNDTKHRFPGSIQFAGNNNDYERQLAEAMWQNAEGFASFGPLPTHQFRVQGQLMTFPKSGPLKGE